MLMMSYEFDIIMSTLSTVKHTNDAHLQPYRKV